MLDRLNYYIVNSVTKEIFCTDTMKFYTEMKIIPETKHFLQEILSDGETIDAKILPQCKIIKIKR